MVLKQIGLLTDQVPYSPTGLPRGTNAPQLMFVTAPGRALSIAAAIVATSGLTNGQLIADMINTAKV